MRLSANLTWLYHDLDWARRFGAAAADGFAAAEILLPYDQPPQWYAAQLRAAGLELTLFNTPIGAGQGRLGWAAIALAALLSGCIPVFLGWSVAGELSAPVVLQLLMCESVYGLLAGIVFWRYGLEAAMLTHVVTYLLSHGLI